MSNYINTIIALDESSGQKEPMGGETAKLSTVEGTIGWWKHNSIKFPKLAQLARQYLSIVPCNQTELDRQNAAYADNILESGIDCVDSEKVSKLLSLRSAIIERSTLP